MYSVYSHALLHLYHPVPMLNDCSALEALLCMENEEGLETYFGGTLALESEQGLLLKY